jgi:hypothetical protein
MYGVRRGRTRSDLGKNFPDSTSGGGHYADGNILVAHGGEGSAIAGIKPGHTNITLERDYPSMGDGHTENELWGVGNGVGVCRP